MDLLIGCLAQLRFIGKLLLRLGENLFFFVANIFKRNIHNYLNLLISYCRVFGGAGAVIGLALVPTYFSAKYVYEKMKKED